MSDYICEFTPVQPGKQSIRLFALFVAPDDRVAIESVQAMAMLRHDQRVQADLYRRDPMGGRETKVWSGLHKMRAGRPALSVVA